jgi:hypothetical protein
MEFAEYDLGQLEQGQVVEITLSGSAANVRLMDFSNLTAYRNGRQHSAYGGLMQRSPARIVVPQSGHWYMTVDMAGLRGQTRASYRLLPG